jgi:predicted RND superfamily exporter protein
MQSAGLPAVIFQDKLIHSSDRSVLYGAVVATNLSQATNLMAQITNLSTVASIDSMAGFFAADQNEKLRTVGEIKRIAASISFPQADTSLANITELDRSLFSTHGYLGLIAQKVQEKDPALYTNVVGLREAISRLRQRILVEDRSAVSNKLAAFQQGLFGDVRQTFLAIRDQDNSGPLAPEDLPPVLRNRFVGVSGKHLIQVYPKKNVWNRDAQREFIVDLQKIDPYVTGTPVQLLEYTSLLKSSYEEAALYSLAAIALMVLIHFRRLSCIFLALLPVGIGYLWMVGLMGVCHVSFNPANIMTLPLIVGIGVTNGIHILNRFAEEEHPSILALSTGKAIIVSALTTIAGFGSLILAKHQGIASLGFIMAVGTATCMIAALTFLPAVLNLMAARGWKIRKAPPAAVPTPEQS